MFSDLLRIQQQLEMMVEYFKVVLYMNKIEDEDPLRIEHEPRANSDAVGIAQARKLIAAFNDDIKRLDEYIEDELLDQHERPLSEIFLPSLEPIAFFEEVSLYGNKVGSILPGPETGDEIIHVGLLDAHNCDDVQQLTDELYKVQKHVVICVFRKKNQGDYVLCEVQTDENYNTDFHIFPTI
ncbi:uncharacterized protein LOC125771220 [Anopheles funestus]|uniref:uncharacterized protein LOC125771220 n=1 Tax=Anopheles funestus TaxID=62324 RepID=UPI0020C62D67|nr:uncharacterized protein LOC125771220 [Anopheles funestus]